MPPSILSTSERLPNAPKPPVPGALESPGGIDGGVEELVRAPPARFNMKKGSPLRWKQFVFIERQQLLDRGSD